MNNYENLFQYTKEELIELIDIYSKNWLALDGVWFQSVERKLGMDEAMYHDAEAWKRFTAIEAGRIKAFLKLGEHSGTEGLAKALKLRFNSNLNEDEIIIDGNTLIYKNVKCRVQTARERKGMPFHPCKPVGLIEYSGFARVIDDRFVCECISCYPDITDESCSCIWKFTLREYGFYGWENALVKPINKDFPNIKSPRDLYDALSEIWSADTCAPRMRSNWSAENKTLGQCSITAFLAQDIFGGEVYGIPRDGGNYHCYNVVGDCVFDLTSEQFGEEAKELVYENNPQQFREAHFAKEEKRLRYERLKRALSERSSTLKG